MGEDVELAETLKGKIRATECLIKDLAEGDEAVSPAIRSSPYLRSYYMRIKARRGTKDARTATARKVAELAWTVWTEHREYEEC